jgi:hypothetical protein
VRDVNDCLLYMKETDERLSNEIRTVEVAKRYIFKTSPS